MVTTVGEPHEAVYVGYGHVVREAVFEGFFLQGLLYSIFFNSTDNICIFNIAIVQSDSEMPSRRTRHGMKASPTCECSMQDTVSADRGLMYGDDS